MSNQNLFSLVKKSIRVLVLASAILGLVVSSTFFSLPAAADTNSQANTIILEIGSASKDDIKDLRYGEGKVFKKIGRAIEQLKEAGEVSENAQPIVVIVKQKRERDF